MDGADRVLAVALFASVLLASPSVAVAQAGQPELVIHKDGTKLYHRPGCDAVRDGKGVLALTRGQAEARGLEAHEACDPAAKGRTSPESSAAAVPIHVYVDKSKYYHRETCSRLQKDSKRLQLDVAGKTYWPCPRCRPPVRKRHSDPAIPK
jgi:hypothetical protein